MKPYRKLISFSGNKKSPKEHLSSSLTLLILAIFINFFVVEVGASTISCQGIFTDQSIGKVRTNLLNDARTNGLSVETFEEACRLAVFNVSL